MKPETAILFIKLRFTIKDVINDSKRLFFDCVKRSFPFLLHALLLYKTLLIEIMYIYICVCVYPNIRGFN